MNDELVSRIVLFVVMVGAGVLLWWMARAAASGRLKRNQFVGIRLPSTMASDEAWLAAHIRAQRATSFAGFAAIVSGLVALLPVPMPVVVIAVLVGCGAILGFVLHGAQVGTRAAAEVPPRRAGETDNWTR